MRAGNIAEALVGNSGGEFGVRGWIEALDAKTGKVAWTAYRTGPDADVKIGAKLKPFSKQDRGRDPGAKSWGLNQWKLCGFVREESLPPGWPLEMGISRAEAGKEKWGRGGSFP